MTYTERAKLLRQDLSLMMEAEANGQPVTRQKEEECIAVHLASAVNQECDCLRAENSQWVRKAQILDDERSNLKEENAKLREALEKIRTGTTQATGEFAIFTAHVALGYAGPNS